MTLIPESMFAYCESLNSVTLPNTLTEIDTTAFVLCKKLESIVMPSSLIKIRWGAFGVCINLRTITIPNTVTEMNSCFGTCIKLESVIFQKGIKLKTLDNSMFYRCISLKSIIIPPSVETIGENCFAGTQSLTSLVFPESITSVASNAFSKVSVRDYTFQTFNAIPNQYHHAGLLTLYISSLSLLSRLGLTEGNKVSLYDASNVNVILMSVQAPAQAPAPAPSPAQAPAPTPAPAPAQGQAPSPAPSPAPSQGQGQAPSPAPVQGQAVIPSIYAYIPSSYATTKSKSKSFYPEKTVTSGIYSNYDKLLAIPTNQQQSHVTPTQTNQQSSPNIFIRLLILIFALFIIAVTLSFVSSLNRTTRRSSSSIFTTMS